MFAVRRVTLQDGGVKGSSRGLGSLPGAAGPPQRRASCQSRSRSALWLRGPSGCCSWSSGPLRVTGGKRRQQINILCGFKHLQQRFPQIHAVRHDDEASMLMRSFGVPKLQRVKGSFSNVCFFGCIHSGSFY